MVIQMVKQFNPEHIFYVPYLQPLKLKVEMEIKEGKLDKIELESFVLPKVATIYSDELGVERIFVDGNPVHVMTEIPSGVVYLVNENTLLKVDKQLVKETDNVYQFPVAASQAV